MGYIGLTNRIVEQTTMTSIAYLPGGFASVKRALGQLAVTKDKWDIKVLEDENDYKVDFEGRLQVSVAKKSWSDFARDIGMELVDGSFDLGKFLGESVEDKLRKRVVELKSALNRLFTREPFKMVDREVVRWGAAFRGPRYQKLTKTAVFYQSKAGDVRGLIDTMRRLYSDDIGYLELLIEAVKGKQPLNAFEGFQNYDYLYGVHGVASYDGVGVSLNVGVDLAYTVELYMQVEDEEVLKDISALQSVKVAGDKIYPAGSKFAKNFFKRVQDAIEEVNNERNK